MTVVTRSDAVVRTPATLIHVGNKQAIRAHGIKSNVKFLMMVALRLSRNDRPWVSCESAASLLSLKSLESGILIVKNCTIVAKVGGGKL